jgi:hypothetical protein
MVVTGGAQTIEFAAGTVSAPSITTTGDTNTGIFFPAADTIAFTEGGTEAMRIDSSGNVGIGATNPDLFSFGSTYKILTLQNTATDGNAFQFLMANGTGASGIQFTNQTYRRTGIGSDNASNLTFATNGTNSSDTGITERMRITSAGEVLVGGTTSVTGGSGQVVAMRTNSQPIFGLFRDDTTVTSGEGLGYLGFYGNDTTSNTPTLLAYVQGMASGTHAAGDNPTRLAFGCTNDNSGTVAEFASLEGGVSTRTFVVKQPTLTNEGQAEIYSAGGTAGTINRYAAISVYKHSGITNACGYLGLSAEDAAFNYLWADNSDVLRISTSGAHVGTTSGTVVGTQTSDERLKDISGPVAYGLNEVLSLEPIAFTMKDDPNIAKIGFSAQQVQPIVPEAVYDTKECIDGYTENEETKEQIPNSDRTKLAMEYTQLIPVLVNAVKELKAELDEAKARIATLEAGA